MQYDNSGLWQKPENGQTSLRDSCYMVFVGFFIGLCAGAVISVFRITTDTAYRFALRITGQDSGGLITICIWFLLAGAAAWWVGKLLSHPGIRSGGKLWLEKALADGQPHAWRRILLPKFIGTWLVIAFGISVGREGPSIEMGAATAIGLKRFNNSEKIERRHFILAGSAAGLAAAFSAPFAGICYVYEIMKEKMNTRLFIFLLSGSFGVYIACSEIFSLDIMLPLGSAPMPSLAQLWLLIPLALFGGACGIAYNYLIRTSTALYSAQNLVPAAVLPFFAFFGAAILLFIYPAVTGEGLGIFAPIEAGKLALGYLCIFLIAKLFFTAYCYGTGVPAGLMVPVLCIGGVCGAIFADAGIALNLITPEFFQTCIVIGMASAFSAAERAPVTGVVLVAQMTGTYAAVPGMLLAGAIALWISRIARTKAM